MVFRNMTLHIIKLLSEQILILLVRHNIVWQGTCSIEVNQSIQIGSFWSGFAIWTVSMETNISHVFLFSMSAKQTKQTSLVCYSHIVEYWLSGHVYRPHSCVHSVLMTLVKILPYRPTAQLIRANYHPCTQLSSIFTIYTDLFVKGICI